MAAIKAVCTSGAGTGGPGGVTAAVAGGVVVGAEGGVAVGAEGGVIGGAAGGDCANNTVTINIGQIRRSLFTSL